MAAPTLTLLNHTELHDADTTTGWTGPTIALEPDLKVEGSNSMSAKMRNDLGSMYYDAGGAPVTAVGKTFRGWFNTVNLAYMDTETNGGYEMLAYDGTTNEYKTMFGSDTYFGGWFYQVISMDLFTTLTLANVDRWGLRVNHTASARNVVTLWIDVFRYLDGYSMTGGTSGDKIRLDDIATADRGTTTLYGYGVLQETDSVYFCTGEMQFGTGATTTYFEIDGQVLVFVDKPVSAGLYGLSGVGSGTNVAIASAVIRSGGTTDATRFFMDWSDSGLSSFSLTDSLIVRASTTTFKSGQTATGNTFDDCGQITHAGADMTDCIVKGYEGTANTSALIYNVNADPDGEMDGMTFEMGTALTHAIEFGTTSPLTMTLRDCTFTGYDTVDNNQNDSTFHVKRTVGTVTINIAGTGTTPGDLTYRSDGATVVIQQAVTVKVTVKNVDTGAVIENARVLLEADTGGDLSAGTDILTGLTNASGILQDTGFAYTNTQPVTGWVRKGSSPEYKQATISGNITNTGLDLTILMVPDTS